MVVAYDVVLLEKKQFIFRHYRCIENFLLKILQVLYASIHLEL